MKMKHNRMEKVLYVSIRLHKKHFRILPKLLWITNRIIFACDIPYTATIDPTVQFGHNGLGTVINRNASLGKNSVIMQHVTLGGTLGKNREYNGKIITSPVIGEHTLIGAGAILLGPIIVGNNCIIGAGTVLTRDVPDNSLVVGIPGKVIREVRADESDKY